MICYPGNLALAGNNYLDQKIRKNTHNHKKMLPPDLDCFIYVESRCLLSLHKKNYLIISSSYHFWNI